jgi:hypothetical protein
LVRTGEGRPGITRHLLSNGRPKRTTPVALYFTLVVIGAQLLALCGCLLYAYRRLRDLRDALRRLVLQR